jgi:hypothetical protein
MSRQVMLNGILYRATEIDGQVIFEEVGGMWGVENRFCFEWMGTGWYLVDFEHSFSRIYASHLVSAVEWLEQNYNISYNNGTGSVSFVG